MIGMYGSDDIDDAEEYDEPDDQQQIVLPDEPPPARKPQPTELRMTISGKEEPPGAASQIVLPGEAAPTSADQYPGWAELAWNAIKGAASNAPVVPLVAGIAGETMSEAGKSAEAAGAGEYGKAALHGVAATPLVTVPKVIGTGIASIPLAMRDQLDKFGESMERVINDPKQRGMHLSEAIGHLIGGLIPVIGPMAANAGEEIKTGLETGDPNRIAYGAGAGAMALTTPYQPKIIAKTGEVLGSVAERVAERKAGAAVTPALGPERWKYVKMGQDPELRQTVMTSPELKGVYNLDTAIENTSARVKTSATTLQAAYDAIPGTRMFQPNVVVSQITKLIRDVVPKGIRGKGVESATMQPYIDTLRQAQAELRALGSNANIAALRRLRQNWDVGAELEFTPSIKEGSEAAHLQGKAWADARTALQDYLNQQEPSLKAPAADYSVWRSLQRVMKARQASEEGRAVFGRHAMTSGFGFALGEYLFSGHGGGVLGLTAGPLLYVLHESGLTTKIASARALNRLADAMQSGNRAVAMGALRSLAATTGTGKELNAALTQMREQDEEAEQKQRVKEHPEEWKRDQP